MIEYDRTGAPTEEYLRHLYGDIIDPLEVIESVASTLDNFEKPEWLIKRLIECRTLGQIYAGWNVGKSALAVDIACRVATGLEFAGRKVCQGPGALCRNRRQSRAKTTIQGLAAIEWPIHSRLALSHPRLHPSSGSGEQSQARIRPDLH